MSDTWQKVWSLFSFYFPPKTRMLFKADIVCACLYFSRTLEQKFASLCLSLLSRKWP